MNKIIQSWNAFWFDPLSEINLSVMRWMLGITMFLMYIPRQFSAAAFFGPNSVIAESQALEIVPQFMRPPFLLMSGLSEYAATLHIVFLLLLALFTLGMFSGNLGRVFSMILWLLHIGFVQRNYAVVFGADLIGGIFLLYVGLSQKAVGLKITDLFKKGIKQTWLDDQNLKTDMLGSVFYRMTQVQLCVIYAYTGFEKLKGASWWDGTALWTVLANPQMTTVSMSWVRHFPLVIVAFTFMTVLFEIYFPLLVWSEKWKKYVLSAGVLLHIGIALFLGLFSFATIMLSTYVLFVSFKASQNKTLPC